MRYLFFAFISLSFSSAFAVTKGQFVGMQMIVNIASLSYGSSVDVSPQVLFEAMDRPEQDSFLGRGKSLLAPQKALNFICARKAENNYQCSIYIHQSSLGKVAPGKAYFEAHGEQARLLFEQFHSQNGHFAFQDADGVFLIDATADRFIIKYSTQGL